MRNTSTLKLVPRPRRTRVVIAEWERLRRQWLAAIDPADHFHRLFDLIPGVYFFAKNQDGRLMFASEGLRRRYAMKNENDILGMTDFDLNPDMMAQAYVDDDKLLLSGKKRFVERLELWWDRQQMPDWFLVTKLPVHDQKRKVIGIIGVLRRPEAAEMQLPVYQTVARAVEIIRRSYSRAVSLDEVAKSCGQSLRQLQRRFQRAFGITPQEFLLKTRVLAAMRMLRETSRSVSEIATLCGFVDASSLSAHFRKRTGESPRAFREVGG